MGGCLRRAFRFSRQVKAERRETEHLRCFVFSPSSSLCGGVDHRFRVHAETAMDGADTNDTKPQCLIEIH